MTRKREKSSANYFVFGRKNVFFLLLIKFMPFVLLYFSSAIFVLFNFFFLRIFSWTCVYGNIKENSPVDCSFVCFIPTGAKHKEKISSWSNFVSLMIYFPSSTYCFSWFIPPFNVSVMSPHLVPRFNYLHRLLFPPLFSVCRRRRLFDKNFLKKKVIQFVLKKIVVKVSWLFCKSGENSLFPLS